MLRNNSVRRTPVLFAVWLFFFSSTSAQVKVDVNLEITGTIKDPESNINTNFRGDDPFNPFRGKIFAAYDYNRTFGVQAQVLFDSKAYKIFEPDKAKPVRFDGLFLSVRRPLNVPVNFWVGKIPTPVADFTKRSYAHTNPLIGFPLMHQYKVALPGFDAFTPSQVLEFRDRFIPGVTAVYEACWITGVAAFGTANTVRWMAAAGKGTLSNPEARENKGFQLAGRIAWEPTTWVAVGISGGVAPYLQHGNFLPAGTSREDVLHRLVGTDLAVSWRDFDLHAELLWSSWDAPLFLEESVQATSWYLELRYQVLQRIYAAGRADWMVFSKIQSPTGELTPWGFDVTRLEAGIGFKLLREWMLKAVIQRNSFDDPTDKTINLYALQSVVRLEDLTSLIFSDE